MNTLKWQWDENPMLPALIFLASGIWCGENLELSVNVYLLIFFLAILLLLRQFRGRLHWLPSMQRTWTTACLLWLAGAGLHVFRSGPVELPRHSAFYGIITEPGDLQENGSRRCLARILRVRKWNGSWVKAQGQAMLCFRGQAAAGFRSGHCILISMPLRGIPAPAIPGEFNAREWYLRQGVYWQAFIPEKNIRLLGNKPEFSLRQTASFLRSKLESVFKKYLPKDGDDAMMSALLLGIRKKMDPELKEAYSAAGLTHILAVSGMHVALIYSFLAFLLSGLLRFHRGRILFSVCITALLWFYALVTGLSPSVLRAVCLFSIMQFSDVLQRPSLPVNNLCFAGIALLMADSMLLFDLGFQLSFAAVFGILSFQPAISSLWKPQNRILKLIQENLSVTLAASLSTLPLILYHFHRFPLYFLFSNLLAVPFSNLLIYAGIGLLMVSPLPMLGKLAGFLLHEAIGLLNAFVTFINSLPFSSFNHLYPSAILCFCLFPALVFLQIWLQSKRIFYLNLFLSLTLTIIFLQSVSFLSGDLKPELITLRYRKSWMILEKQRTAGKLFCLTEGKTHPDFLQKGFKLNTLSVRENHRRFLPGENPSGKRSFLLCRNGKTMLVLNHFIRSRKPKFPIRISTLILDETGQKSLLQALNFFRPDEIWLDWDEKNLKKLSVEQQNLPRIRNFRFQKFSRTIHSDGKAFEEWGPEFADSRTN